jgi:UPF0755 protein
MRKNKKRNSYVLIFSVCVVFGLALGIGVFFYSIFYMPNVKGDGGYFYIRTGSTKADVVTALSQSGLISKMNLLNHAMERLQYEKVYAGRFKFTPDMGNKQIVRLLASNLQLTVNLKIPSVQTQEKMAGAIARQIELDSATLMQAITDKNLAQHYGFSPETFAWMLLPNTYQVYWNISSQDFFDRMHKEWEKFWEGDNRAEKLKKLRMSKMQVLTLASIVSGETNQEDEMPNIAGVYINRLRTGMRLQADPTVRFAMGAGTVGHRILLSDTQKRHAYNTYIIQGLPPGPINFPAPHHIDAVLNYQRHSYLYFCAKEDFSGYHTFAKTYSQHLVNARKYQSALNQRKIFR